MSDVDENARTEERTSDADESKEGHHSPCVLPACRQLAVGSGTVSTVVLILHT
jgi:hypothetical protein